MCQQGMAGQQCQKCNALAQKEAQESFRLCNLQEWSDRTEKSKKRKFMHSFPHQESQPIDRKSNILIDNGISLLCIRCEGQNMTSHLEGEKFQRGHCKIEVMKWTIHGVVEMSGRRVGASYTKLHKQTPEKSRVCVLLRDERLSWNADCLLNSHM